MRHRLRLICAASIDPRLYATSIVTLAFFLLALPGFSQGLELVWSDEFGGSEVDPGKWEFQIGDGCPNCGWGNDELQYYRAENASVSDGTLVITAKQEAFGGREYTSARLRTLGRAAWRYGRLEARARVPKGKGMWPAFWMMPARSFYGGWAASGEIDIMEARGSEPNTVLGTLHFGGTFPDNTRTEASFTLPAGDFSQDFHEFAVEWEPWEIRWYVDGQVYSTLNNWYSTNGIYPAPFDQEFYILLNLAVGGNFDGAPDATTAFPQTFEIDYVRAYRWVDQGPSVEITSPSEGEKVPEVSTVSISATAFSGSGNISFVRFFQDDGILGTDTDEPFQLAVPNARPGCFSVSALATDVVGWSAASDTVHFAVEGSCPEKAPYLIQAAPVPGTIEFEDFDLGGEGVSYHDTTPENNGNAGFRESDGVDIQKGTDANRSVAITFIEPGEWAEYEVDVASTDTYEVVVRVAGRSRSLPTFRLEFDGTDRTGPIEVPYTGSLETFTTVRKSGVFLEQGLQTMRFVAEGDRFSLDKALFVSGQPTGVSIASASLDELQDLGAFPNPFAETSAIRFRVARRTEVKVDVYDVLGRHVDSFLDGPVAPGVHEVTFRGRGLPNGLYLYVIRANRLTRTGRLMLLR
jgi:beta-glucanase (GH16 family)